jgi:serine/threonine protein kinase/Flp pilus assembly protein TadD
VDKGVFAVAVDPSNKSTAPEADNQAAPVLPPTLETGLERTPSEPPTLPFEDAGSRIGPYKLLQQLGEGGMGIVFKAEQQEPVRRLVAVKVIKAGMDSVQVITRFEAERQALALMDHPNIAKVHDANKTENGRPYFVMELVKGIPITKYCDEHRLTVRQRLELFVPVCQAIQHAHQKGIIHRDIKPSNVLVADYDGKPVPKVIDFGVAKAMGQKLTEHTLHTGFGGIVGTLPYMSPEQAALDPLDIDTRSDVYSLGVLLYELLTGTTPLTWQRLKDAPLLEVLRWIREEEPSRLRVRLSTVKDSLASVSAQRQVEPSALLKAVRGEVDWIVMKALEKDRTRRYETANGFAQDIQRYLAEEPVEAGPPSATYRMRKLAWKWRRGLATAAALLLLLVAGVVVSTSLAVRAVRAEKEAVEESNRALAAETEAKEQRDKALTAEAEAKKQRDKALTSEAEAKEQRDKAVTAEQATKRSEEDTKAVLDFLQKKVLSAGRPKGRQGGLGGNVSLRVVMDAAEPQIAKMFADRPLVEASIRNTLGETYWHLGDYGAAIRQDERALALRESKLGPDHPDTLLSRNDLGTSYADAGRTAEAIRLLEQNLKLREIKRGADHPDTLQARNNLAAAYQDAGRTAEAIRLHEQNLKQREAKLGIDHPDTLMSRNNLAESYRSAGRIDEAIRLHEQNLNRTAERFGPEHPDALLACNNLALAYENAGRRKDAIRLYEQILKLQEVKLGSDHPETLVTRNNLAAAYDSAGRTAEAIGLHERNLKLREVKLGPDHPDTLTTRNNLAEAYRVVGRTAEAIRLHEQNLKQREATLGPDHPNTLTSRHNLAAVYRAVGRIDEAIRLYEKTLKGREAKLGVDHPNTLLTRNNLANSYRTAGRTAEAIHLYEQNLKLRETKLGADHPDTQISRNNLAVAYGAAGRIDEAIRLHEENLKLREDKLGPDHPNTLLSRANLGVSYRDTGRFQEAISSLEEALQRGRNRPGGLPSSLAWVSADLAATYDRAGQFAKAEPLYQDLLKQARQRFGAEHATTAARMATLGRNLLRQNKYADAEPLLLKGHEGLKQRGAKLSPRFKTLQTETVECLVQLYEATGKKEEADKWRKQREQGRQGGVNNADKK